LEGAESGTTKREGVVFRIISSPTARWGPAGYNDIREKARNWGGGLGGTQKGFREEKTWSRRVEGLGAKWTPSGRGGTQGRLVRGFGKDEERLVEKQNGVRENALLGGAEGGRPLSKQNFGRGGQAGRG